MNGNPRIIHIVVAGGSGARFGAPLPKQFCDLGGRPMLMETIERMREYGCGGEVVAVIGRDYMELWDEMCRRHGFVSPPVVAGGATRFESVRNAIEVFCSGADMVTVHDGARPLVSRPVVEGVVEAVACGAEGAVPAVAVVDSLRRVEGDGSSVAVDRTHYRAVQTPQGFRGDVIRRAYSVPFSPEFTDDASVVEACGGKIVLVEGDPVNIKVTHRQDLEVAGILLKDNPR